MDKNLVFGIVIIISVISFNSFLVFYSRHLIEKISKMNHTTVRDIMKELHG
ncbi:MAG: hypothetical protein J7K04_14835 [Spirochaetales bacterium]|nr:hypothetical protein [Spirochaetales bacterium]